ncbi:MAG: alcohol dehydrogenase catalytic domain-containing protein [Desulfobacteraceae bacterium]|nr:alcohol dehydrogenase catalytic domain-containing protein [Desulfobacteraceae bacterium]
MAIDGAYNVLWSLARDTSPGTITLKVEDNALSGSSSSDLGQYKFEGGKVTGDQFEWSMLVNAPQIGEIKVDVNGTVSGDDISGQAKLEDYGSATFRGTRATSFMRAAVVTGKRQFEIRKIPTPVVRPGTLLLKVKCCAICGTDLEFVDHHGWAKPSGEELFLGSKLDEAILGHEWVGEVVEVGEGVEGWSVGDRVVDLRGCCGQCYWCRRGFHHLCMGGLVRIEDIRGGTGWASMYGAMAEYVLRPAQNRIKVPDSVSDEEAALTEPLNVGLSAIYESGMKAGDSVAILGGGHIGQLTLLSAKAAGAAPIILTDRIQSRLDKALELGADYALNVDEGDVYEQIVDITEAGADVIIICVRDADVIQQSTLAVRREGTIALLGFPKPAQIDPIYWLAKRLRIVACDPSLRYNVQAMRLMQYKQIDCKPLVSAIMPLENVGKAFDSLYAGENLMVMLKP